MPAQNNPKASQALNRLRDLIQDRGGALSLFEYMAFCLSDLKQGYYATKQPLGRSGDFITAPELSQVFGELIGVWFVNLYESMGCPDHINMLEMGPGRGLLMQDCLRAFRIQPKLLKALSIHMLEINPHLQLEQINACVPHTLSHYRDLDTALTSMTTAPLFVMANEFLDVFPIHQYRYQDKSWHECAVTLSQRELHYTTIACDTMPILSSSHAQPSPGDILEYNPLAIAHMTKLGQYIQKRGGGGLMIDYGYEQPGYGDTLQAVSNHKSVDPLREPGNCDLTTHVDFQALIEALSPYPNICTYLQTQKDFLEAMGIGPRTEALATSSVDSKTQNNIRQATHRLTNPHEMGTLFKCLSFWHQADRTKCEH